jgi:glutathione S-transferase
MCPYAARTWITLLELGLPFELIGVNARNKEDWFLAINPRGKVPAIQNMRDGAIIYESVICNEYLSDYARQSSAPIEGGDVWKLVPVDAAEKAAMRLLNDHVDTQLGPVQYTFLMNDDTEKDLELKENLEEALRILQAALKARGGPFLMGKHFTLADAHVLPFFLRLVVSLKHFKGYEIPQKEFAPLLEWYALCSERDSVKAASKSDEKIIEVYQKFVDMKYGFGGLNTNK